jgi:hypothetical protein
MSPSANRQSLHRERRRRGLKCVTVEIRNQEIIELVRRGLLAEADQGRRAAIAEALHRFMDEKLRGAA